jgi:hypothetical protein
MLRALSILWPFSCHLFLLYSREKVPMNQGAPKAGAHSQPGFSSFCKFKLVKLLSTNYCGDVSCCSLFSVVIIIQERSYQHAAQLDRSNTNIYTILLMSAEELSDEKLARELEAQKKRVAALKYLAGQGQNVDSAEKTIQNARHTAKQSDNTLELMLKQRAATTDPRELEKKAKAALLLSQNSFRSSVASRPEATATTESDWKEAFDKESSKSYYWNVKTNETRWDKPEPVVSRDAPSSSSSSSSAAKKIWIGDQEWTAAIHPATNQEYWINSKTGDKRFEIPTASSAAAAEDTASARNESSVAHRSEAKGQKRKISSIDPLDPTDGKV